MKQKRQLKEPAPVVEFRPRELGRHDFCICTDANSQNLWQAWTILPVDEALANPEFFAPMRQSSIAPGDSIELFEIYPWHLDAPETDPLAMAAVIVIEVRDDPVAGPSICFQRMGETLHFNGGAGAGVHAGEWNGKYWVWKDGRRHGWFHTRIEMNECADELRKAAS